MTVKSSCQYRADYSFHGLDLGLRPMLCIILRREPATYASYDAAAEVTAQRITMFVTSHKPRLHTKRDKLAPRMKELADQCLTAIEAADETGVESKRAGPTTREHSFNFSELQ